MSYGTTISSLKKTFRFYTPVTNNLEDGIFVKVLAVSSPLSDGQLIALTLNEVCAEKGRGEVLWVPNDSSDWIRNPRIFYHDKRWTDKEKTKYFNTTPWQRLQDCKAEPQRVKAGTKILGLFAKVFRDPSDEDEMSWPEITDGRLMLCYRNGQAYLDWTEDWEKLAKLNSAHFHVLRWQKVDQNFLSQCALGNHSLVIEMLEKLLAHEARWVFSSTSLPLLSYILRT